MASGRTIFNLMRSEVNADTGDIDFKSIGDLTPMYMASCEITTKDASDLIEFGTEPEIIPYGIGSCEASISGTFYDPRKNVQHHDASSIFPVNGLAGEIKAFYDTIKLFDRINEENVQYALKLSTVNDGGTRELDLGIWKIKKIAYDRKSKELGKYRFNMTLSYFWKDKLEQMINENNTGNEVRQSCEFEAYITDSEGTTLTDIKHVTIQKSLHQKNTARFDTVKLLDTDSLVLINIRKASRIEDKNVFLGIVISSDANRDGLYTNECREIMELLYKNVCSDPNGGIFSFIYPRVVIPTVHNGNDKKISEIVKAMLTIYYKSQEKFVSIDFGEGVDRTNKWGESVYLPGRSPEDLEDDEGVKLSTQVISGASIGKGLSDFLYQQCGLYTWVNYETKKYEYGFLRDGIDVNTSKEEIIQSKLISHNKEDVAIDGVMVFSPDATYVGYDGEIGPDKNIVVYQLHDSKNDLSLEAIAHRIFEYSTIADNSTYDVTFPAGVVRFKEGDYFKGLGDQSLPGTEKMEYRDGADADVLKDPGDSVWQIKEMTITEQETKIRVGTSYYSVLDIYKQALERNRNGVQVPTKRESIKCKEIVMHGKRNT